jgi:hypothetical protein
VIGALIDGFLSRIEGVLFSFGFTFSTAALSAIVAAVVIAAFQK